MRSRDVFKWAWAHSGIQVQNKMFFQLEAVSEYDGIWACSSILHLPKDELENVLHKMSIALKMDGIIYTSFKYGDFSGWRNGRYFTDMTEEGFADVIQSKNVTILEKWITGDVRPNRGDEKWLNLLLKKK